MKRLLYWNWFNLTNSCREIVIRTFQVALHFQSNHWACEVKRYLKWTFTRLRRQVN